MDTEILVHIKAPARAVDDRRYVAIAQAILDFEPVCITRIQNNDHDEISSQVPDTIDSAQEKSSVVLEGISTAGSAHTKGKRTNRMRDHFNVSKNRDSTRLLFAQRKDNNPPFKSPLRKNSSTAVHACTTPLHANPVTAANGSQPILVPNTEDQTRKRSWADIDASCSRTAMVANSQPASPFHFGDQSWSTWSQSVSQPVIMARDGSHRDLRSPGSVADLRNAAHQTGNPGDVTVLEISEHDKESGGQTIEQSRDILNPEAHAPCLSQLTPAAESAHATTQLGTPQAASGTTTATPTQYSLADTQTIRPGITHKSPLLVQSHIDLVTPEFSIPKEVREEVDEVEAANAQSIMPHSHHIITNTNSSPSFSSSFHKLKALPLVIDAPNPQSGQLFLPACRHPVLRATAEALGMPDRFKPQTMTRAVKSRERGYWNVPIHIVGSVHTNPTRHTSEQRRNSKADSWQPLFKHASLTEEEFITIWADLTQFINSGKAGYNVKVIRRSMSIKPEKGADEAVAQFHLQAYCYGEAIPYVYALLLVCTRMHVLCRAIQWVSAVNEEVVLTMTGSETRKGNLGVWTHHSDAEGRQFWHCS